MQARFDRIEWLLESQQLNHMITSEGPPFACDSQHQCLEDEFIRGIGSATSTLRTKRTTVSSASSRRPFGEHPVQFVFVCCRYSLHFDFKLHLEFRQALQPCIRGHKVSMKLSPDPEDTIPTPSLCK
jgi:hypothetical protein